MLAYNQVDKQKITGVFAGTVFITFLGVVCYRGYKQVSKTEFGKNYAEAISTLITTFQRKFPKSFQKMRATNCVSEESCLLINAPEIADYSNLREPLIESELEED